jgi:hypothetical protein
MTLAQRKAKINGWIKEYEKRLKLYEKKYGKYSLKYKTTSQLIKQKISLWKLQYDKIGKIDKSDSIKKIVLISEEYYLGSVKFSKKGGLSNVSEHRSFLCKFLIDANYGGRKCGELLKTSRENLLVIRNNTTKSISESTELRERYKLYKLYINNNLSFF